MSLLTQLLRASTQPKRTSKKVSTLEEDKKRIRETLSSDPMSRKAIIEQSGLSPERVDRALRCLLYSQVAVENRPGELKRRVFYSLGQ
jgi:predicted HTH transcriptional regulator